MNEALKHLKDRLLGLVGDAARLNTPGPHTTEISLTGHDAAALYHRLDMFKSVTIVQGTGPDHVSIQTTFPSPCPNFDSHELCLDFQVAADGGPAYVAKHFPGLPVELIPRPTHKYEFSK
jgi:hypothetical protein